MLPYRCPGATHSLPYASPERRVALSLDSPRADVKQFTQPRLRKRGGRFCSKQPGRAAAGARRPPARVRGVRGRGKSRAPRWSRVSRSSCLQSYFLFFSYRHALPFLPKPHVDDCVPLITFRQRAARSLFPTVPVVTTRPVVDKPKLVSSTAALRLASLLLKPQLMHASAPDDRTSVSRSSAGCQRVGRPTQ